MIDFEEKEKQQPFDEEHGNEIENETSIFESTNEEENVNLEQYFNQKGKSYSFARGIVKSTGKLFALVGKRFGCDEDELSLLEFDDEEVESMAGPLSLVIDKSLSQNNPEVLLAISVTFVVLPRIIFLYDKYSENKKFQTQTSKKLPSKNQNSDIKENVDFLEDKGNKEEKADTYLYENDEYDYGDQEEDEYENLDDEYENIEDEDEDEDEETFEDETEEMEDLKDTSENTGSTTFLFEQNKK